MNSEIAVIITFLVYVSEYSNRGIVGLVLASIWEEQSTGGFKHSRESPNIGPIRIYTLAPYYPGINFYPVREVVYEPAK